MTTQAEPEVEPDQLELLLVTGMSGAGRSTAARALEDQGWFVIDNLPPPLLDEAVALIAQRHQLRRLAVVLDVRSGLFFDDLPVAVAGLRAHNNNVRVLFLQAGDEVLVHRFESNRRPHPLQGKGRLLDGIAREREVLADLRAKADLVIDTSTLNVHDLRRRIDAAFEGDLDARLRATVLSFGFKNGLPVDADLVADVRFLPNPHWIPELREMTGLDAAVADYVFEHPEARAFLDQYSKLIDVVADGYLREGKRYVTVAVGCTGGRHRSVAMAENLAARLVKKGVETLVMHRDLPDRVD
ncbi:MAG: RNase adapter protein RapZ [Actinomycetota bacterium]|nr:RNase adapter protein RapZ [Actinomycetota bacterium]